MDDKNKITMKPKQKKFLSIAGIVVVILIILLLLEITGVFSALGLVLGGLQSVLFGILFSCILNPLQKKLERYLNRKFKKRQRGSEGLATGMSVAISVIVLVAILVSLVIIVLPQLADTLTKLMPELSNMVKSFNERVKEYSGSTFWQERIYPAVENFTNNISSWVLDNFGIGSEAFDSLTAGISSMLNLLLNAIVGIIMSIYLLMDKKILFAQINKISHAVFGKRSGSFVMNIINDGARIFSDFFGAKIFEALINGLLCFFVMVILQLPYATLISVIVGVANIIPFFGPWIGVIIGAAFTALISPLQSIVFIIVAVAIMVFDSYVIGPRLLGRSTGISAFWVIVSIMVFGYLMGVVGMLIGVPLFAWIYCIVKRLVENSLKKKDLDTDTDAYMIAPSAGEDISLRDKFRRKAADKAEEQKTPEEQKTAKTQETADRPENDDNGN